MNIRCIFAFCLKNSLQVDFQALTLALLFWMPNRKSCYMYVPSLNDGEETFPVSVSSRRVADSEELTVSVFAVSPLCVVNMWPTQFFSRISEIGSETPKIKMDPNVDLQPAGWCILLFIRVALHGTSVNSNSTSKAETTPQKTLKCDELYHEFFTFSNHYAFRFAHFRFLFKNRKQRRCWVDRSPSEDDKTADSHVNIYCVCQLQFNDLLLHFRAIFPQRGELKEASEGANDVFRCNKISEVWAPNNETLEWFFQIKTIKQLFCSYNMHFTSLPLVWLYCSVCVFSVQEDTELKSNNFMLICTEHIRHHWEQKSYVDSKGGPTVKVCYRSLLFVGQKRREASYLTFTRGCMGKKISWVISWCLLSFDQLMYRWRVKRWTLPCGLTEWTMQTATTPWVYLS